MKEILDYVSTVMDTRQEKKVLHKMMDVIRLGDPVRITDHAGRSVSYGYAYDVLNRLNEVEKDGAVLRSYQYDSFGNRIGRKDYAKGVQSAYTYDALNRLLQEKTGKNRSPLPEAGEWENWWNQDPVKEAIGKSYTYDRRGNLTGEYQEGKLLHGYEFGVLNRMEKSWDLIH